MAYQHAASPEPQALAEAKLFHYWDSFNFSKADKAHNAAVKAFLAKAVKSAKVADAVFIGYSYYNTEDDA